MLGASVSLAIGPAATAQPKVPFEQDNHAFRFVLDSFGYHPASVEDAFSVPTQSIVIFFGQTSIRGKVPANLFKYLEAGGAVLIATDRKTDPILDRQIGVHVTGEIVQAWAESSKYRGSADYCPLITVAETAGLPASPFRAQRPVATNKPSYFERSKNDFLLPVLATFPDDCRVNGERKWRLPFALGGKVDKGRLLVLSDHSVFINGMMLQPDNDNFEFACNCLKWLNNTGHRWDVLFVDEGTIVHDFKVPVTNLPMPPISPMAAADHVIAALEEDDLFNRLILEHFSLRQIVSAWAVVLTLMLLAFLFYRLMRSGHHVDTQAPLLAQGVGQVGPTGALVVQRRQSLLQEGNLWEAAREVARQWFADAGYDPAPAATPDRLPRLSIRIDAGWWERRRLRGQVARLWRLAFQPKPQRVSRRDFERLLNQVHDLRTAAQQGVVQFQQPGTSA
jgi:hypothetical protein